MPTREQEEKQTTKVESEKGTVDLNTTGKVTKNQKEKEFSSFFLEQ